MRFLYKIYSGYDGFTPARIRERFIGRRQLRLGWGHYLDQVEKRDEVWVFFHGPGVDPAGVYAMATVREVDFVGRSVVAYAQRFSVTRPLTDAATARRVSATVAPRGRQVFLYPERWRTAAECDVDTEATSCSERHCGDCPTWRRLMIVGRKEYRWPSRLPSGLDGFVPAYWAIPRRSFVYTGTRWPSRAILRTSDLFMRFKLGDEDLAYPLALGMYTALRRRGFAEFDTVVPYPLSPEKVERSEFNRTKALGGELARLFGTRPEALLRLTGSISKRALRTQGRYSAVEFEQSLMPLLRGSRKARDRRRILLVDDVCTDGSTLRCATARLWDTNPDLEIVASTAALMVKAPVVASSRRLLHH